MMRRMNHARILALVLASASLLASCESTPAPRAPVAVEARTCGAIQRLHEAGGVWLGSQPSKDDLGALHGLGVKTVVSLRQDAELKDWDEAAAVRALGMEWLAIPWQGPEQLTDEVIGQCRAALRDAARPLFVHCASGNRVGAVWIPFRVLDEGVDIEKAAAEARMIGLKTPELEAKARDYVARHGLR